MLHRPTSPDRRGFTLVELVLVVLIVGVIGAIAMPRFAQATARQQLAAATQRVVSDLERARQLARASSSSVTFYFDEAQDSYAVTPTLGEAWQVELDDTPYQTSLSKADFDGNSTVVFNGFGIPSSGGSVVLESGVGSVEITLATSGQVTR